MISEKDKQAILNGAYGISRGGKKCKFVGKAAHPDDYTHKFIYLNNEGLIYTSTYLNNDFKNYDGVISDFDVIGLWEDKPEPFDLERALAGEPVMLRNGLKANILIQIKDTLIGYFDECSPLSWDINGDASLAAESNHDIVSMWKEPEPVSKKITVTLPRALKEPQDEMWFVDTEGYLKSGYGKCVSTEVFNRRVFFGSEEDAKAWFDAMQDSRK